MFRKAISCLFCLSLILSLSLTGCTKKESGPINAPKNVTEDNGDSIVEESVIDVEPSESEDKPDPEEGSETDETIEVGESNETQEDDSLEEIEEDDSDHNISSSEFISINDDGYIVLGSYEQDGDLTNGQEPLEWVKLDENDQGILLMTRYVIDVFAYNQDRTDITWEKCTLRRFLNSGFYNNAFSDEEKKCIVKSHLENNDNLIWETPGGNDTLDHVFCLSLDELISLFPDTYNEDDSSIFDQVLMGEPTPYALNNGIETETITYDDWLYGLSCWNYEQCDGEYSDWWLRSPGEDQQSSLLVSVGGSTGLDCWVDYSWGIRPAIYVNK